MAVIERDMAGPYPMHRLLQGDVGSGKTVVAVAALLAAVQGGHQGALDGAHRGAGRAALLGVRALLGGLDGARRRHVRDGDGAGGAAHQPGQGQGAHGVLAGLATGAVDIVIGTHALLTEEVVRSGRSVPW